MILQTTYLLTTFCDADWSIVFVSLRSSKSQVAHEPLRMERWRIRLLAQYWLSFQHYESSEMLVLLYAIGCLRESDEESGLLCRAT